MDALIRTLNKLRRTIKCIGITIIFLLASILCTFSLLAYTVTENQNEINMITVA